MDEAVEMLDSIKMALKDNDLLDSDLDGIANRCSGQLYKGERTRMIYRFPTYEKG